MSEIFNNSVFLKFTEIINDDINEHAKKNNIDKENFMNNELLKNINTKNINNPYNLDKYNLPIRFNDKNKLTAMGWYINENNDYVNINVDNYYTSTPSNLFDVYIKTYAKIKKNFPNISKKNSMFYKIICLVEENTVND